MKELPRRTGVLALPMLRPGSSGHGKTNSPQDDFATLLKVRRATDVRHEHARSVDEAEISYV